MTFKITNKGFKIVPKSFQKNHKIISNMAQKCSHRLLNSLSMANMELILSKTLISKNYILEKWPRWVLKELSDT